MLIEMSLEELTFLEEGKFTKQDRSIREVAWEIMKNYDDPLKSITDYIILNIKDSKEDKAEMWRKRSASEIIKSRKSTGCSDIGIVFCALAREMGYATAYVETLEEEWLNNPSEEHVSGHIFVKIKTADGWKIYEPKRGFIDDYVLKHKDGKINKYIEIGCGLDFNEVYLKTKTGYTEDPVSLLTIQNLKDVV